jgi:1-acyl-sn-glycerol-3-phosphate acyltransferase
MRLDEMLGNFYILYFFSGSKDKYFREEFMGKIYWTLYGCYFIICLYIKKFYFERIKKKMAEDESYKYAYDYAVKWTRRIIVRSGSKVTVIGEENIPEESCLFVSNHQEYFDILILMAYLGKPIVFIAKKELGNIPAVGYWMRQVRCIFLDKSNTRESLKSILEGVDMLKKGHSVYIAPEGRRSMSAELGEFKKGSLKLAIRAEVPVVPITFNNVYKITEGKSFLNIKPADIYVKIEQPIYTKYLSKEEQNNLSEDVRAMIEKNLFRD